MMSHFFSMIEFIDYCNKVLPNEDRNMPYVFAGFSGITAYALLAIGGGIWYYQLIRQIRIFRSNVNHFIVYCKILISVNIIYILSYFSPFMILAFLNDPLAIFSRNFEFYYYSISSNVLCTQVSHDSKASRWSYNK